VIDEETKKIIEKYERKLGERIEMDQSRPMNVAGNNDGGMTKEYSQFKQDMIPQIGKYEKWCKSLGNFITIKVSPKDREKIQKNINIAHLDITPSQVLSLAIITLFLVFFTGILITMAVYIFTNAFPMLFLVLIIIASLFIYYYSYSTPERLANKWRLKASSQMVPCILYMVAYMKHTSNLERAVRFVAENLESPLNLDFKKVYWDVETGKYPTIKESLDAYLEIWRDYSIEFIESIHLIESSLYEPNEAERVRILERALQVILDGVYEKMLKYSHTIRSPLTNLYMLGIVLPTLALALLPLASTLLGGAITWYHVIVLFNIVIPFFVYYLSTQIMLKRPGGHGETQNLEQNPNYPQYKSKKPYVIAAIITIPLLLIGLSPIIMKLVELTTLDITMKELGIGIMGEMKFIDFKEGPTGTTGPFGVGALLISMLVPISIAAFYSISAKLRTKELIKARNESNKLEDEYASSLFQLGNRIGDGMPAEVAFGRIADSLKGQTTENFYRLINTNIQQGGMSLEEAIFNKRRGAIVYYPSTLIATSMKILVESVKKGLQVAARSLMSISEYVKNIHKISERLRDLLAEVVSDMKSNMTFLAPLLSGIVIGLATMITTILGRLELMFTLGGDQTISGIGSLSSILSIFELKTMIPPYYLQVAIGIYIIQVIIILTGALVTVDSGEDRLKTTNELGKNLKRGMILYAITAIISIVALTLLASIALKGI